MTQDSAFDIVNALDEKRAKAVLSGDFDTVDSIIGSTLRYVHGSGLDEDRSLYLQRLREGYYRYHALDSRRREFRRFADVILVHGDVRIHVTVNGAEKDFVSRYLQVWASEAGNWKMVAWESTPLPAATA